MKNQIPIIILLFFFFSISYATNRPNKSTLVLSFDKNEWKKQSNLPFDARYRAVSFTIGGKAYVGTGFNIQEGYKNDFWEYNPLTDTWISIASLPAETRYGAVAFTVDDKAFVCAGKTSNISYKNDLWEYIPHTNEWKERAALPANARTGAVAFTIDNRAFVSTGSGQGSIPTNDLWEYVPQTDRWIERAAFPGDARHRAVAFTLNNKAYLGTGQVHNDDYRNDFWEYDPTTDTWKDIASLPAEARYGAIAFTIGQKAYVGTGKTKNVHKNDFWEYDPTIDSWLEMEELPDDFSPRYFEVTFTIADNAYVGTGRSETGNYLNDLWKFTPNCSLEPISPIFEQETKLEKEAFALRQFDFKAHSINGTDARISWTSNIKETRHFELKRRQLDQPWKTIQVVPVVHTDLESATVYDWTDENIFDPLHPTATHYYYRLKVVDQKGEWFLSNVEEVKFEYSGTWIVGQVFPNPMLAASPILQIPVTTEKNIRLDLGVFSVKGRKIHSCEQALKKGSQVIEFRLPDHLAGGIYVLKIQSGKDFFQKKLVLH